MDKRADEREVTEPCVPGMKQDRQTAESYRKNELPVDKGWAWVICFAGFLSIFVFIMSVQTIVVLFLELVEMYDTSITTASLIFLILVIGMSTMSLISSDLILPKLGERCILCVMGVLFSLCSVAYSLAPSIEIFLLCAAVKGMTHGAAFVPSISLIRHYFHRRRSLAQILANAGGSVAAIVVPPLVRAIRKEFGIRGTFLIVAGLELHLVLAGLLMRPVSCYKYRPVLPPLPNKRKVKGADGADQSEFKKDETKSSDDDSLPRDLNKSNQTNPDKNGLPDHDPGNGMESYPPSRNNGHLGNNSINENYQTNNYTSNKDHSDTKISSKDITASCFSLDFPHADVDLDLELAEKRKSRDDSLSVYFSDESGEINRKTGGCETETHVTDVEADKESLLKNPDISKLSHRQNIYTSAMSLASNVELESAVTFDKDKVTEESKTKRLSCSEKYWFFRLWVFRLMLLASVLGASSMYVKNYVPTIAVSQGATYDEAAMLMTLMGVIDLVSRLGLGIFADLHVLKPSQILALSELALGIIVHLTRFFNTFSTLVVMSTLLGVFIGTRISLLPLVAMEVVGTELMPQAFSIITICGTFSTALLNPALGAVAESTGSFIIPMHILGVIFFLSFLSLMSLSLAWRLDKRQEEQDSKS